MLNIKQRVQRIANSQTHHAKWLNLLPPMGQQILAKAVRNIPYEGMDPLFKMIVGVRGQFFGNNLVTQNVAASREALNTQAKALAKKRTLVKAVHDFDIDGPQGFITLRQYRPDLPAEKEDKPTALMVFFHGGGFVVGDLDSHDEACRIFCHYGNMQVISVNYRLAPEHKAPAAVEDCLATTEWAIKNAGNLNVNPNQIIVAGDSAGGNLAAVISQQLAIKTQANLGSGATFKHPLCAQILIYPVMDAFGDFPSRHLYGKGLLLSTQDIEVFAKAYLQNAQVDPQSPLVNPMGHATPQLPPAYVVTAEMDILRDEGEQYAKELASQGVYCELKRVNGLGHGFINLTAIHKISQNETIDIAHKAHQFAQQFS